MKRETPANGTPRKRLVLRRDTLRVLDEDALHQARGGLGSHGSKAELEKLAD